MTLSGLQWIPHSPSLYELADPACHAEADRRRLVTIAYDGRAWLIAVRGVYGTREFRTRDEAASLVANAFTQALSSAQ